MEIGMEDRRYLLDLGQMLDDGGGALFQEAFHRVDQERQRKALRIRGAKARAASIGAGLLLQKALADYAKWQTAEPVRQPGRTGLERFSVEGLLAAIGGVAAEPVYGYGSGGKPYLADHSFQFNLSHSGSHVFCGVSEQEIGVDIQQIQGGGKIRLAKRFFSAGECRALEDCPDEETRRQLFFRMWARKEAYGKLTGRGLADAVGRDLLAADAGEEIVLPGAPGEKAVRCSALEGLAWEEYDEPAGYRIAVCKYRFAERHHGGKHETSDEIFE